MPSTLIFGPGFVPVRRRIQSIPPDKHRPRLLAIVQSEEKVREPDDCTGASSVSKSNCFRQTMIRSVRQGIAVDDEKRADSLSRFHLYRLDRDRIGATHQVPR